MYIHTCTYKHVHVLQGFKKGSNPFKTIIKTTLINIPFSTCQLSHKDMNRHDTPPLYPLLLVMMKTRMVTQCQEEHHVQ